MLKFFTSSSTFLPSWKNASNCELPILVAEGTYVGELVNKWGVGLTVDSSSLDDLVNKIVMIKENSKIYNEFVLNCKKNKEKINITSYNDAFMKELKAL